MNVELDSLELSVKSSSENAAQGINKLVSALGSLKSIAKGGAGLTSVSKQLERLGAAFSAINIKQDKISQITGALNQLSSIQKATGLSSSINALKKLPEISKELEKTDLSKFATQMQQVADAVRPLASEMEKVSKGFSAFPIRIQKIISANTGLAASNSKAGKSFGVMGTGISSVYARMGIYAIALQRVARVMSDWIVESNNYVENLNLFTVAMGDGAKAAYDYAYEVNEALGIDPSEWMRNQGVFKQVTSGFGVAEDRANIMSKNLTQLGYDIASFFNISVEDAMQKVQSGIAGEIEPMRRLGYAIDVATLQEVARAEGITKSVNAMNQAEKSQLRYLAIMNQSKNVMGDMARTVQTPANAMRILQQQITQLSRALGNLLIPFLQKVIPYVQAFVEVLTEAIQRLAVLVGFELPTIDYSGLDGMASSAGDVTESLGGATAAAKELKNATIGLDELNIISPNTTSGGAGGAGSAGSGDLGFDLPEYDFLEGLKESPIGEIVDEIKEWLGLTEDISSWSDLFGTRLGHILTLVSEISGALILWKLSQSFLNQLSLLANLKKAGLTIPATISIGLVLASTGTLINVTGIIDAIYNGLSGFNFAEIVLGGLLGTGGLAVIGSGIASWITSAFSGSAIANAITTAGASMGGLSAGAVGAAFSAGIGGIIFGIPAFFVGIYDACVNQIDWLSAALTGVGATAAGAGIGALVGMLGGPIGAGVGALIGLAVGALTDGIILIVQKWDEIKSFFENFFTVTLPELWKNFTTWLSNIPNAIATFFESLPDKISTWFDNLWKPIQEYDWENLGNNIGTWFGNALRSAIEFVTISVPGWIGNVLNAIKNAFSVFFTTTLPTFMFETVPNCVQDIANFFQSLPQKILDAVSNSWETLTDIGGAIIDGIFEGLGTIGDAIKEFVDGFIDGVRGALGVDSENGETNKFYSIAIDLVQSLLNGLENSWENITTFISTSFDNIKTSASEGFQNLKDDVIEIWDGIWEGIKKKINVIINGVETMVNSIIKGINGAIKALNNLSFTVPDWVPGIGGNSFGFNIGLINPITIPRLASGGVAFSATQAIIGEYNGARSNPEIVSPQSVMKDTFQDAYEEMGSYGSITEEQAAQMIALLSEIVDKDLNVNIGDEQIGTANDRYKRNRGVMLSRGVYANAY